MRIERKINKENISNFWLILTNLFLYFRLAYLNGLTKKYLQILVV